MKEKVESPDVPKEQEPDWEKLAEKKEPPTVGAYEGCWADGEMTGFARCMIKHVKPLKADVTYWKQQFYKQSQELAELRAERDNTVFANRILVKQATDQMTALSKAEAERDKLKEDAVNLNTNYVMANYKVLKLEAENERLKELLKQILSDWLVLNELQPETEEQLKSYLINK